MKLRVKGNERLVRDPDNFAILNTDRSALKVHEQKMEQLRRVKNQQDEINTIKRDVSEIKDMLSQLLKSNNK
jgi:conjugal transfer/entry exclusion protein